MSRRAYGLRAWVWQRLSAAYMVVYLVALIWHFASNPTPDYQAWHEWLGRSYVGVSTALFFTALLLHAWVGGRDVLLDYIHAARIRFVSLAGLALGLIALGFWVIHILYSVR